MVAWREDCEFCRQRPSTLPCRTSRSAAEPVCGEPRQSAPDMMTLSSPADQVFENNLLRTSIGTQPRNGFSVHATVPHNAGAR